MAKILRRDIAAGIFRRDHGSFFGRKSFSSNTSDGALVEVNPGEVGIISGIPQQQLRRRVLIYSPARTASQQGSGKVGKWKINFLSTQKWENPLMGWTSTGDPYANVGEAGLSFNSAEAAKAFAEKHGWEYEVFCYHCRFSPKMFVDDQALQCGMSFLKPGGGNFDPFTNKRSIWV